MSNAARRIEPLVDPYVDGELPPEKMVEVEQLMLDSEECREQVLLSQALKESMRHALADEEPSASFEARLRGALHAERQREEALEGHGHGRVLPWKYILPIAAAAGFTLVLGASGDHPQSKPTSSAQANVMSNSQPTPLTVDALVDELVSHHAAPPPEPE
ncbi:MAG: hypothetical protein KC766_20700, partial [Myxococcales bacterium]|nr:hypothetical protein [Myxococcales bacterium]